MGREEALRVACNHEPDWDVLPPPFVIAYCEDYSRYFKELEGELGETPGMLNYLIHPHQRTDSVPAAGIQRILAISFQRVEDMNETERVFGRPDSDPVLQATADLVSPDHALWGVMDRDYFDPDLWLQNTMALSPVLLPNPRVMNYEMRSQLLELYHAFIFGQWLSVSALARAILERIIKDKASRFGVSLDHPADTRTGKARPKSLEVLNAELAERFPGIASELDIIRDSGNQALHAPMRKKSGNKDQMLRQQRLREEALRVIRALKAAMETLLA
jgi:hypothetical protein